MEGGVEPARRRRIDRLGGAVAVPVGRPLTFEAQRRRLVPAPAARGAQRRRRVRQRRLFRLQNPRNRVHIYSLEYS